MDHDIWLCLFENGKEGVDGCDITIEVLNTVFVRSAVSGSVQVEHGNVCFVRVVEEVNNVVAEEAAAANDEHITERFVFVKWSWCHLEMIWTNGSV